MGFRKNNLILNIPHSSTWIPDDFRKAFVINAQELRNELLVMTDWYTDELFDHKIGNTVIAPVSRLVCDTERFAHNEMERQQCPKTNIVVIWSVDRIGDDSLLRKQKAVQLRCNEWRHCKKSR